MKTFIERLKSAELGETHLFWLGQAGFIIKSATGKLLGIDLYLSDCVEEVEGHVGYHRLMPQIVSPEEIQLDVLIATHFHRDHFDIGSMASLMSNGQTHLFCAYDCMKDTKRLQIDMSRVQFVRHSDEVDDSGYHLDFIHADHGAGAPQEVAVIITVDGKRILVVGDTSLHLDWTEEYLRDGGLDVLIAPINGAYGNLNEQENVILTRALMPCVSIPSHFGMFGSHGGNVGLWKEMMDKLAPNIKYKIFTMGEGFTL